MIDDPSRLHPQQKVVSTLWFTDTRLHMNWQAFALLLGYLIVFLSTADIVNSHTAVITIGLYMLMCPSRSRNRVLSCPALRALSPPPPTPAYDD